MSSQASETLRTSPTATVAIVLLCCALYAVQLVLDLPLQALSMCPRLVIYLSEYYRVVTSALFHGGFMHIGMNMMSTAAIGSLLERRLGTLAVLFTILLSILFTAIIHIGFAFAASLLFGYDQLLFQHSIGFSGVIFHLSVLESNLDRHSRSLFGFVSVPALLYPWCLLVLLQVIMPNLSFTGHLAGIVAGTLQLYGILDPFMVTDKDVLREMQDWRGFQWLSSHPGFVAPPSDNSSEMRRPDVSSLLQAMRRGVYTLFRWIGFVVEALWVIVFGRGSSHNANIQLGGSSTATGLMTRTLSPGGGGIDVSDHNDEEWNGLPAVVLAEQDHHREPTQQFV